MDYIFVIIITNVSFLFVTCMSQDGLIAMSNTLKSQWLPLTKVSFSSTVRCSQQGALPAVIHLCSPRGSWEPFPWALVCWSASEQAERERERTSRETSGHRSTLCCPELSHIPRGVRGWEGHRLSRAPGWGHSVHLVNRCLSLTLQGLLYGIPGSVRVMLGVRRIGSGPDLTNCLTSSKTQPLLVPDSSSLKWRNSTTWPISDSPNSGSLSDKASLHYF